MSLGSALPSTQPSSRLYTISFPVTSFEKPVPMEVLIRALLSQSKPIETLSTYAKIPNGYKRFAA